MAHCSVGVIGHLERGLHRPGEFYLRCIADALRVPHRSLFEDVPPKPRPELHVVFVPSELARSQGPRHRRGELRFYTDGSKEPDPGTLTSAVSGLGISYSDVIGFTSAMEPTEAMRLQERSDELSGFRRFDKRQLPPARKRERFPKEQQRKYLIDGI